MSSNDIEGNSAVHNASVYQSESTTVAKFTNSLYRSCFYNRLAWPITEPICLFLVKFANALVAYSVQQLDAVALCRNELLWCLVNERQKHLFRSLYVEKLNSNNVPRLQSFRSITSWVVYFIIFINSSLSVSCWPTPSVLWHCWLGDRKGIRPLTNLAAAEVSFASA